MPIITTLAMIEIKAFLRNWTAIFWTFAYPVALLVILSLVFGGSNTVKAKIEVIDEAKNIYSERYLNTIHDKIDMVPRMSLATVYVKLDKPITPSVIRLHLPKGFGEQSMTSAVKVIVKGALDPDIGGLLAIISEATEVYNRATTGSPQQFYLDYSQSNFEQSSGQGYNAFLVSGLTALTVVSTAMFGFTSVLVEMRQNGALKMFQVFPMKKHHFIAGFVLSRTLVLSFFCILFFYISNWVLGTNVSVSALHVASFAWLLFLGIVAFLGVGLLLVSMVKKGATAIAIINIINLPIIFLSDLFIPVASMPEVIRSIAEWSPVYLFVNAMRGVPQAEFVLSELMIPSVTLLLVAALTLGVSSKLFQWRTS